MSTPIKKTTNENHKNYLSNTPIGSTMFSENVLHWRIGAGCLYYVPKENTPGDDRFSYSGSNLSSITYSDTQGRQLFIISDRLNGR